MRVKIEGRITVERLAQALQEAAKIYERACPGHAIYGANLYLNAYRADGLQFGGGDPDLRHGFLPCDPVATEVASHASEAARIGLTR